MRVVFFFLFFGAPLFLIFACGCFFLVTVFYFSFVRVRAKRKAQAFLRQAEAGAQEENEREQDKNTPRSEFFPFRGARPRHSRPLRHPLSLLPSHATCASRRAAGSNPHPKGPPPSPTVFRRFSFSEKWSAPCPPSSRPTPRRRWAGRSRQRELCGWRGWWGRRC